MVKVVIDYNHMTIFIVLITCSCDVITLYYYFFAVVLLFRSKMFKSGPSLDGRGVDIFVR